MSSAIHGTLPRDGLPVIVAFCHFYIVKREASGSKALIQRYGRPRLLPEGLLHRGARLASLPQSSLCAKLTINFIYLRDARVLTNE